MAAVARTGGGKFRAFVRPDSPLAVRNGGRGGIRTHGEFNPTFDFESSALNRAQPPFLDERYYESARRICNRKNCLTIQETWKKQPYPPARQENTSRSPEHELPGQNLFEPDENRERGDPEQIHYSKNKEQSHQRPAAAGAEQSVRQPHHESSGPALAPMGRDELERGATTSQAALLAA